MRLVILPGMDGQGFRHDAFLELLDPGIQVTRLTLPASLADYDALFDHFKEKLPAGEYAVLAESFSGPLAILLAAHKSPKALIFLASFASKPLSLPKTLIALAKYLPLHSVAASGLAQRILMGRKFTKDELTEFRNLLEQLPKSTLIGRLLAAMSVPSPLDFPNGCTVISSRQDWLVNRRATEHLKRHSDKLHEIDAPHFALQARPRICASLVSEILKRSE